MLNLSDPVLRKKILGLSSITKQDRHSRNGRENLFSSIASVVLCFLSTFVLEY